MKAMIMTRPGGPEVLKLVDVGKPALTGPRDVLVRVHAAGVNPVDTKLRARGTWGPTSENVVLGCDGAGVVEAVGDDVRDIAPGEAVFWCYGGIGLAPGTYAEYVVVPEYALARKPERVDFATAAAAPLVLITAWESLFDRAGVRKGQRVFIHAGAGGVGHVAVQLARIAGCEVAVSVSTTEKADLARELGADKVIRYREQDVAEALLDWTDGEGVDMAFDTVGGAAFCQLIPAVKVYGDLVSILQFPPEADFKTARIRNLRLTQELMLTPMLLDLPAALAHQADILRRCAAWIDEGRLRVVVSETMPLAEAARAHERIEAGGMTGKLALMVR